MRFISRGGSRPEAQNPIPASAVPRRAHESHKRIDWAARTVRLELFILILGSALLLAAVSLYLAFSGDINSEAKRVDTTKYQAIFLNSSIDSNIQGGQQIAYFGHITKINDKYVVLQNVYWLTSTQTKANQTAHSQLAKLGCQQLHSPYDEMVINRGQLAFWENLKDSGKVVTAIKQYQQQNPKGPNCSTQSTTPAQSTTSPVGN